MPNDKQDYVANMIPYFYTLTQNQLSSKYDPDKLVLIMEKYQEIFAKLIDQYDNDPAKKYHALNPVFLIALNDSQEISRDELLEQMLAIYRTMLDKIFTKNRESYVMSDNPWKDIVDGMKIANAGTYENEFFKCKTAEDNGQTFGFDLNRCIYVEIFKENNKEKLAPLLCEFDGIFASYLEEWLTFERKETIADGHACCTFRFYKK